MRPGSPLAVLGAPSSAGAYGPGQENAPAALRSHGLLDAVRTSRRVTDHGDGTGSEWCRTKPDRAGFHNIAEVVRVAGEVRTRVGDRLREGDDVLVLGGDCSLELGVVAGALDTAPSVGLLYVDLDADLTTATSGDGILDWTGVAHLLGITGTDAEVAGLGPRTPMLAPADVVLLGTDSISAPEQQVIDAHDIRVERLDAVRRDLPGVLDRVRDWSRDLDVVCVHVDVDVLARDHLFVAENDRRVDGLHPDQLEALLRGLCSLPNARTLTVCEINPAHAPDEAALERVVELVAGSVAAT